MTVITTIVHFSMPKENMDEFFTIWKKAQAVMVGQPGALDNLLNRTIDTNSPFQFINVAHWESAQALTNALTASVEHREPGGAGVEEEFKRLGVTMSQNNYVEVVKHLNS
jgi:heme-degrading monooxygenase HmoA